VQLKKFQMERQRSLSLREVALNRLLSNHFISHSVVFKSAKACMGKLFKEPIGANFSRFDKLSLSSELQEFCFSTVREIF
jgi:hypothetical protein